MQLIPPISVPSTISSFPPPGNLQHTFTFPCFLTLLPIHIPAYLWSVPSSVPFAIYVLHLYPTYLSSQGGTFPNLGIAPIKVRGRGHLLTLPSSHLSVKHKKKNHYFYFTPLICKQDVWKIWVWSYWCQVALPEMLLKFYLFILFIIPASELHYHWCNVYFKSSNYMLLLAGNPGSVKKAVLRPLQMGHKSSCY